MGWLCISVFFNLFQVTEPFKQYFCPWWNLATQNSTNLRILREPRKELAEPLSSSEPRLKNTAVYVDLVNAGSLCTQMFFGSISSTFYTHVLRIAKLFSNYSSALWLFGKRISTQKLLVKWWWNWYQQFKNAPHHVKKRTSAFLLENMSIIYFFIEFCHG